MKLSLQKTVNKSLVVLGFKEPPRRRGLGKKNPVRVADETKSGERALAVRPVTNVRVVAGETQVRNYKQVSGTDGINSDWVLSAISQDSDVWQNGFALRQRMRDLYDTDSNFVKYTEELFANVPGWNGYSIRLLIKETEDRIVYSAEKDYLTEYFRRRDQVAKWLRQRKNVPETQFGNRADRFLRSVTEARAAAQVEVGDFDLYAIKLIEDAFEEWQKKEFCTVTRQLEYNETRQLRILSCARDGDFFIRHVRDPKINKFGYALQLINAEWCDYFLNAAELRENGNEIRMGVELDAKWKYPVAYWFIKRQPSDWQFSTPGMFSYNQKQLHERIPADEIIHYARRRYADSTRPAPWGSSVIVKARHLDKGEEAEVAAMRASANKMGFFYSDIVAEGGMGVVEQPDPAKAATLESEPGSFQGLPYGVKFQEWNPNHPNQDFPAFRKEMLRSICAGLPGANYNIIANDLEGVNYSSGRLGMLDERELWKLIQRFDIDTAERPIFENWLYMALLTGAVPLPLAKFDKYNKARFRGRRWAWVDPAKEIQANAMAIANKLTSRTRVVEDSDIDADFEEILFEQAEEEMLAAELGMDLTPAIGKTTPQNNSDGADDGNGNGKKPAPAAAADDSADE